MTRAWDTLRVYGHASSLYALLLRSMEQQQLELDKILARYTDMFDGLALLDEKGNEMAKVSRHHQYQPEELGSEADSLAFQQAIAGEEYVATEVRLQPYASHPTLVMAVPFTGRDNKGVLLADVRIEGMWDAVAQVEVGEEGYAYIVDRSSGELIALSEPDLSHKLSENGSLDHIPIVRQVIAGETEFDSQYRGLIEEPVIGAAVPIPYTNWSLIVELPSREALADVRQMLVLLAVLAILGVVVAASLGLFIPRRIVRPLLALQAGAEEIGAGNLEHTIRIQTGDELQDLAEAFNQMAVNLQNSQAELEQWGRELEIKVRDRTHELAEAARQIQFRAIQLETSAEVARAIASVRDPDHLLPRVAQFISERFGWYHVGIFLVDEVGDYAVLRAANSPGGRQMLERGHRLKVGEEGIVGTVIASGQPRIALDVGEDAVHFTTPELPNTRSEMALPLRVSGRIIGALDVQSTEVTAYDEDDIASLNVLADQVAIAIENARLFEQTQRALEDVQSLHRQYVQHEWSQVPAERRGLGYEYQRSGTPSLDESPSPEMIQAMTQKDIVAWPGPEAAPPGDDDGNGHGWPEIKAALAAPIKLRDQVIGVLNLQETDEERKWTDDEIALVQAVSDQVALALENARLFADTQRRAEQVSTINRIGLSISSDLDLGGVLNALFEQIRRILDVGSFYVALYDPRSGIIEFPLLTGVDGPIQLERRHIDESPGVTGHIIHMQQPLHLPDIQAIPDDAPFQIITLRDQPTRSYLGVPMISRDRVIGVISIQSYQANAYTEDDVELLATIATQASAAIENARAYERLSETAERLAEVDRLKTQFLANMSHELRTPLNSIIGFSRVMLKGIDGPLTDLQEADLTSIYNSGQHLLGLINSVLDMSKIEAGKMDLSFEEVSLLEVFDGAMSVARALLKDKPIELHAEIPSVLPTVWADAQRVRQVLFNLLSNAAKFTEEGHIVLRAEADPEFVIISVSDTGIGIDEEAQERLFIPFQQVDGSTTRRAEGTGLGLAISRSFIEMHGGEIWVESDPGIGSTFAFTLPVYQIVIESQKEENELKLEPGKKAVLAIDDDAGVITLLRRYLENDNYQVIGATHSDQAMETAQRLAPNLTAITLDVMMPEMDGWQVLQSLKQNPKTKDIPVIMCSIVEDLKQGLEQGAAICLQKPVTRDEVLDALEKIERWRLKTD
jgi:signal transduction histidine kinase/CheY-like chemotaxis protein